MRTVRLLARLSLGVTLVVGALPLAEREARACGGCFTPPPTEETESVITDEKMVLSVSMSQTTLYDQISYSGAPASFAWVLPVKGTVEVGLSADVMFQVLNTLTATEVLAPPTDCPPAPVCNYGKNAGFPGENAAGSGGGASSSGVTVTAQAQVGPYETVQLHSTDGSALTNWLTAHGYQIPDSTKPVIDAYVSQQFDFLALKLVPGEGIQSMQPVRVTSQGAAPTLPLHMVAVGTGATTGITIWVVADARWAPSNFPTFTIADSEIVWDWATESSNYETVRLAKEAALKGAGWQIESSLELSQYTFQQTLLQNVQYAQTGGYLPAPPVAQVDAGTAADASAPPPPADASVDQSAAAMADLAVLFNGVAQPNARITRMRSDVAKAALTVDMTLEASADQSELTNIHVAGQQTGEPTCTIYNANNCEPVGSVPRSVAQSSASAASAAGGNGTGPGQGDGAGAGGGKAGGGCSTTSPPSPAGTTLAFLTGLVGVVAFRTVRKRRRSA